MAKKPIGWCGLAVRLLLAAVKRAKGKRLYIRLEALLLLAKGKSVSGVSSIPGVSRQAIYLLRKRYFKERSAASLTEGRRNGPRRSDAHLGDEAILSVLSLPPRTPGYRYNAWMVALLAHSLNQHHKTAVSLFTLKRRIKTMGLRYKRPNHVYEERSQPDAKKGVIIRKLNLAKHFWLKKPVKKLLDNHSAKTAEFNLSQPGCWFMYLTREVSFFRFRFLRICAVPCQQIHL